MIARSVRIFELPGAADILRQCLEIIEASPLQIAALMVPEILEPLAGMMPFVVIIETTTGYEVMRADTEAEVHKFVGDLYVLASRNGIRDFQVMHTVEAGTKDRLYEFLEAMRERVSARVQ